MRSASLFAVAAGGISAVNAVYQGFNYGSTQTDGSVKDQATFESEFKTAKALVGTSGFTSARLYTMIQGGTTSTPISAIPAAIAQQTTLLLGLWASGGQTGIDNEITALKSAITTYGTNFTSLVAAISVGSEDLYRDSSTGQLAKAGVGAGPDVVVSFIKQVRTAIEGTTLSGASVGHVDTWNAWTNGSNSEVITNCDWLGMDTYPYYQNTQANSIDNAKTLFYDAYDATVAVAGGKEVWITETGWPVSGTIDENEAVASLANAKTYWDEVGCPNFGSVNTYWYTLQDAYPTTPNPSFGIVGSTLSTTPLYDLTCSSNSTSTSSSASSSSTSTSSASSSGSASASSSAKTSASSVVIGGSGSSSSASSASSVATSTKTGTSSGSVVVSSGVASATGTTSHATTVATTTKATSGSGSTATTTSAQTTFTGAAAGVSGSMIGAVGAIFALVAAL